MNTSRSPPVGRMADQVKEDAPCEVIFLSSDEEEEVNTFVLASPPKLHFKTGDPDHVLETISLSSGFTGKAPLFDRERADSKLVPFTQGLSPNNPHAESYEKRGDRIKQSECASSPTQPRTSNSHKAAPFDTSVSLLETDSAVPLMPISVDTFLMRRPRVPNFTNTSRVFVESRKRPNCSTATIQKRPSGKSNVTAAVSSRRTAIQHPVCAPVTLGKKEWNEVLKDALVGKYTRERICRRRVENLQKSMLPCAGSQLAHSPIEGKLGKGNSVRNTCLNQLRNVLHKRIGQLSVEEQSELSDKLSPLVLSIEEALWKSNTERQYRKLYRKLYANINDSKNGTFFKDVLTGRFTPEQLAKMDSTEMASEEKKQERQLVNEKSLEAYKRASDERNDAEKKLRLMANLKNDNFIDPVEEPHRDLCASEEDLAVVTSLDVPMQFPNVITIAPTAGRKISRTFLGTIPSTQDLQIEAVPVPVSKTFIPSPSFHCPLPSSASNRLPTNSKFTAYSRPVEQAHVSSPLSQPSSNGSSGPKHDNGYFSVSNTDSTANSATWTQETPQWKLVRLVPNGNSTCQLTSRKPFEHPLAFPFQNSMPSHSTLGRYNDKRPPTTWIDAHFRLYRNGTPDISACVWSGALTFESVWRGVAPLQVSAHALTKNCHFPKWLQDETIRRRGFVASFICASQALEGISKKFSAVAIFALSPKFPVTAYRQYERLLEYLLSPSGISMASIELTGKQFAQEAFIYPLDKEARPPPSLASHLGEDFPQPFHRPSMLLAILGRT